MAYPAWFSHGRLVLASNNRGKVAEFQHLFEQLNLPLEIVPQGILNIADAVEDGLSFVENAIIKARHASKISGLPAIADDSGLCVPILNHAPGIYSARYAGQHGDDHANNQKLLHDVLPYRSEQQHIDAMFVCVLALVEHADDPLPKIFQATWQGELLSKEQGEHGFGYDPLFLIPSLGVSSAELSKEEKNKISHRGQAMALFAQYLQTF